MTNSNTNSRSQKNPYRNQRTNSEILNDDLRNGNVVGNMQNSTISQVETEILLRRIAFTVWHTALYIEREVRYLITFF